ncbi:MAG TPA: hypothetical protein VGR13_05130 [Actinomycetota bacterium]|jgi:hypothetical protein|nr:hypothetical protein [Actinomycetota bacterium]
MARAPITKANPYRSTKHGHTFHTEREYRNFLARRKGFSSWSAQQRAPFQVRSIEGWRKRSRAERDAHNRALLARNDLLRGRGTKDEVLDRYDLTKNAFHRHVGGTIEYRLGRWVPTGQQPFRRDRMLTRRGERMVIPRNDRQASRIGEHWNAAKGYGTAYGTDRESEALAVLRSFDEDRIDGEAFMTDPDDVLDYFETHPDSFESIYDEVA